MGYEVKLKAKGASAEKSAAKKVVSESKMESVKVQASVKKDMAKTVFANSCNSGAGAVASVVNTKAATNGVHAAQQANAQQQKAVDSAKKMQEKAAEVAKAAEKKIKASEKAALDAKEKADRENAKLK